MAIRILIKNTKGFSEAFLKAPRKTKQEINLAVRSSLAEILKRETDNFFKFKTPRAKRTGMLQRTFHLDTAKEMNYLKTWKNFYHVETKSTVKYAKKVVRRGNPFYARILADARPDILKHNEDAIQNVLKYISKVSKKI